MAELERRARRIIRSHGSRSAMEELRWAMRSAEAWLSSLISAPGITPANYRELSRAAQRLLSEGSPTLTGVMTTRVVAFGLDDLPEVLIRHDAVLSKAIHSC